MTASGARCTRRADCRYCGGTALPRILSLGPQPPSNSFLRPDQAAGEARYPLDVYGCAGCGLVQLLDVVPAESIFDDYLYLSSTSRALREHYGRVAAMLAARFGLGAGDVAVDIGCNDGVLLQGYPVPGLRRVGVEPSKVGRLAAEAGVRLFNEFFTPDLAARMVQAHGTAAVVTATNVFAHVDDIGRFVDGLPVLLGRSGVFVIESPYLVDLIDGTLFDTIYHEHLCYLSLTPMVPFLARHGLEVFDVERVPFGASGPAIRVFVQPAGAARGRGEAVDRMLDEEARWGIRRSERYADFAGRVAGVRDEILALIADVRRGGARLGGYGAPAKGNTLLNYLGLTPETVECIAETNARKQGLLTPGSHIPIISEEAFLERMPPYALLLSWNYLDFLLERSEYIRRGGRFVVPLPVPRVLPAGEPGAAGGTAALRPAEHGP